MPGSQVRPIKRCLQKHLRKLVEVRPVLQALEKESEQTAASLTNLLEQRECIERVDRSDVALLSQFPDLRERLLSKLSHEVDRKAEALRESTQPLQDQLCFLCQAQENLRLLLSQQVKSDPDFQLLVAGTPIVPSLKMMLDWIDSAERQIRELYCTRKFYLSDLAEQHLVNSDNFEVFWKEDAHLLLGLLSDCEAHMKYFLEEKI